MRLGFGRVAVQGRFRANREHLETFYRHLPEIPGQNLALTVLNVPYSLQTGQRFFAGGDSVAVYVLDSHTQTPHTIPPTPTLTPTLILTLTPTKRVFKCCGGAAGF